MAMNQSATRLSVKRRINFLYISTHSKPLIGSSTKQAELYLMRLPPEILNQSKS